MAKIDLTALMPLLGEKKFASLEAAVTELEAAVATGKVRNKLLTDAKFIINRRVEDAVKAFDDANGRLSWDRVLVSGAYNVPAALKEMVKKGNEPRAALLRAMLPLHELFQAAKPLIVKRGSEPTAKQIEAAKAREGHEMTCQCCGRGIFAERGKIAHHGYERPSGEGYQTASCMGALYPPFEVSRTRLGAMIRGLTANRDGQIEDREKVVREERGIGVEWLDYSKRDSRGRPGLPTREYAARLNFAELTAGAKKRLEHRGIKTWEDLKRNEIERIEDKIKYLNERIAYEQKRFDGWKQTHEWAGKKWVTAT